MGGKDDSPPGLELLRKYRRESRSIGKVLLTVQRQNEIISARHLDAVFFQRHQKRVFHQVSGELDALGIVALFVQVIDVRLGAAENDVGKYIRHASVDLLEIEPIHGPNFEGRLTPKYFTTENGKRLLDLHHRTLAS